MSTVDYEGIEKYIAERLSTELPSDLYYHAIGHTMTDVLPAVERLAKLEGVAEEDLLLLQIAVLYHDTGYIEQYLSNEPIGAENAAKTLPYFGCTDEQIETIHALIMVTQMPQSPTNHLERIMCDADLDSLGREDFFICSHNLRVERIQHGEEFPLKKWYIHQLEFLRGHHYFTPSARTLRDPGKAHIIAELETLFINEDQMEIDS